MTNQPVARLFALISTPAGLFRSGALKNKLQEIQRINHLLGIYCQMSVDKPQYDTYLIGNRTLHASASACAPGGSFFAQITAGKAGFP